MPFYPVTWNATPVENEPTEEADTDELLPLEH